MAKTQSGALKSILNNAKFSKLVFGVTTLLGLTYLVAFSSLVPMTDEDYNLYGKGMNIVQLWQRCLIQYREWNARIGDCLSIVLSELPILLYNILNAFAIFGFIFLLQKIAKILIRSIAPKYKFSFYRETSVFLIIFLFLAFFILTPGQILFWRTGSASYFYPLLFMLAYSLPLIILLIEDKDVFLAIKQPVLQIIVRILYVLGGVIIGHANENTSPVFTLAVLGLIVYRYVRFRKVDAWVILTFIALVFGTYTLLFGSSTKYRLAYYSKVYGHPNSYFDNFKRNLWPCMKIFLKQALAILALIAIMSALTYRKVKQQVLWIATAVCFAMSFLAVIVMTTAPYFEARSFFFTSVMLLIPLLMFVYKLPKTYERVLLPLCIILTLIGVPSLVKQYVHMVHFERSHSAWVASITEQLHAHGKAVVPVPRYYYNNLVYTGSPAEDPFRIAERLGYPDNSVVEVR